MRRQLVLSLFSAVPLTAQLAALPPSGEKGTKGPSKPRPVETRLRLGGIHLGAGFLYAAGYPYPGMVPPLLRSLLLFCYDAFFFPVYQTRTGHDQVGRVRLKNLESDAEVYVDGGYAGPGSELKSFYLDPGSYRLSVRQAQRSPFEMKLYILSGTTQDADTGAVTSGSQLSIKPFLKASSMAGSRPHGQTPASCKPARSPNSTWFRTTHSSAETP